MINHWKAIKDFHLEMNYNHGSKPAELAPGARMEYAREYGLALFMEVAELVESFDWKPWRDQHDFDKENLKREIIDCLYFLHHIADLFEITEHDLNKKFVEVDTNNRKRYIMGDFSKEDEVVAPELKGLHAKLDNLLHLMENKNDSTGR